MPRIQPHDPRPLLPGTLQNLFFPPERYNYFERAAERPFLSPDPVFGPLIRAAWAADASMLGYARYGKVRMTEAELEACLHGGGLQLRALIGENGKDWNASGTQAYFAIGKGFAVLAFRGTEADDPQDLRDDADLVLAPEHDYHGALSPPDHLGHLSSILQLISEPCLVHRGFQRALGRVWTQVYSLLANYRTNFPDAEILITGHSLGGALALLTYSRFRDPHVSACTIGCPRVGDIAFVRRVLAKGAGHFRCVNFNDLVAHVPPESVLYRHAPQMCWRLDQDGTLDQEHDGTIAEDIVDLARAAAGLPADLKTNLDNYLALPAPPALVDHSPARYCMRLWDLVPRLA